MAIQDFYEQLLQLPGLPPSLKHRVDQLAPESDEVRALRRAVMLPKVDSLLLAVDDAMDRFAKSVRYVEPLRATAERYYREQDLALDEIDSRGTNTAMFLSSLSDDVLSDLQKWMLESFGFQVEVEIGTGHVQIKISDGIHTSRNIADLGFGYSQMLPIILQLWRGLHSRSGESSLLAMEQPELHLHPHFQAKLADVMAGIARRGNLQGRMCRLWLRLTVTTS